MVAEKTEMEVMVAVAARVAVVASGEPAVVSTGGCSGLYGVWAAGRAFYCTGRWPCAVYGRLAVLSTAASHSITGSTGCEK